MFYYEKMMLAAILETSMIRILTMDSCVMFLQIDYIVPTNITSILG